MLPKISQEKFRTFQMFQNGPSKWPNTDQQSPKLENKRMLKSRENLATYL